MSTCGGEIVEGDGRKVECPRTAGWYDSIVNGVERSDEWCARTTEEGFRCEDPEEYKVESLERTVDWGDMEDKYCGKLLECIVRKLECSNGRVM